MSEKLLASQKNTLENLLAEINAAKLARLRNAKVDVPTRDTYSHLYKDEADSVTKLPAGTKSKRKSPDGESTNDLVHSAYTGSNDDVFPHVISLFVEPGSVVADVTYGKGVFWRNIPEGLYELKATDLSSGVDCRTLPYENNSIDCVVFDPPYMHTPGGSAHVGHQNFEAYYRNNISSSHKKYHEAVLDLYFTAADEAFRVLKTPGFYIVKCQDEVCANRQRLTHVEIINALTEKGFVIEDLFVVVRAGKPGVSRALVQAHARKNHSYFLVFYKPKGKKRWLGLDSRKIKARPATYPIMPGLPLFR